MKNLLLFTALIFFLALCGSCNKDVLDEKPDKSQLVPTTLDDFQELLNNNDLMNLSGGLSSLSTDDLYNESGLPSSTALERNAYPWLADIYQGSTLSPDWNTPYQQVLYANIVLDGLAGVNRPEDAERFDQVKGEALFFRCWAFFNLAQLFCVPYSPANEGRPGIPMPLSSNVNVRPPRGTLKAVYDRVLADLAEAKGLLPERSTVLTHPSKAGIAAFLSRIYLVMGDYAAARAAASEALGFNSQLTDFNTLNFTATYTFPVPLPNQREEIAFYNNSVGYSFFNASTTFVDSLLYRSYGANDLRRQAFFVTKALGKVQFKGNYSGGRALFTGLATDEIYLNRAEASARLGDGQAAMTDLNTLLKTRYKTGTFTGLQAADAGQALRLVMSERRKELINRGIRWTDLRRYNLEKDFAVTLRRMTAGAEYTLPPDDPRYVFPIPPAELQQNNLEQNPR
ncbi:RagB/SusD family nutrient uptake outer membrane protein [Pedobacter sp. HMF7647]|uniref:RagB/SusD family nutrient uptake outer membrane protein n=1 Tax=Hufsiella arboris TaxID=2695275 RepID=A0A7K1Y714_9SPHI|nr:RagB/SusD family nutrient uptake outer membrane protein [Hufsiella arboris]MXV50354.1 RagB/SusD family nutrient uptake outer membrane protein [Hufsiella arboris]